MPLEREDVLTSAAVVAGVCLIGAVTLQYFLAPKQKPYDENEVILELLEGEREGMIHAPAVATVTLYDGAISACLLEKRVADVVAANPWLDSRLINIKTRGGLCAVHPPNAGHFKHFSVVKLPPLPADCGYTDILSRLDGDNMVVKMGSKCVNANEPLFSVVLVEFEENKKYALVMSMSHVIGDGHTYYSIFGMLSEHSEIKSLIPIRKMNFMNDLNAVQGPEVNNWLQTPTTIIGLLLNMFARTTPSVCVHELDPSKIQALKEFETKSSDKTKENEFVSTNDVVSSSFFRSCNSEFALVCLNYRGRIPGYSDEHAGNYESVLAYAHEDFQTAMLIRESLATQRSRSGRMPGIWSSLVSNMAVTTNWSSFYKPILLSGATQVLHLPVVRPKETIFRDLLVIFRPSEGRLAVLYVGRNLNQMTFVEKTASFIGKSLF